MNEEMERMSEWPSILRTDLQRIIDSFFIPIHFLSSQFMPLVMPPLLRTAAMIPKAAIFDSKDKQKDMNEVD